MKNKLEHIAIIMDGNGRWAKSRNKIRSKGHLAGMEKVREITTLIAKKNIPYLTLYAFSTENWKRPKQEVSFLMSLLRKYLKTEESTYMDNNIKFNTIGDLSSFDKKTINSINKLKETTKINTGLTQTLALNYGSRNEITRAINKIKNLDNIKEEDITNALDSKNMPDVDVLIRTGGEKRLSNFLLWQSYYSEIFFINTLWPDITNLEIESIIQDFETINRRFGEI
jgi:undecaprenyl diphosphate synthase